MQEKKSHHTVVLATEYAMFKHTETVFGIPEQRLGERVRFSQAVIFFFSP